MAKKILSFEEYAAKIKGADVSEEEIDECPCGTDEEGNCIECEEGAEAPAEEPAEEIEDEEDDSDDDTDDVEDIDDEDDSDDEDEDDDEDDDDDDEEEDDDDDEEDDEEDSEEEVEAEGEESAEGEVEAPVTVEAMLSEGYAKVKEAACAYEKDEYQDHTLEAYMKENAALVATLAAQAMEEGYGEVKETDLTQEMYEAHCNEMKEAYAKKMDEMKEAYGSKA